MVHAFMSGWGLDLIRPSVTFPASYVALYAFLKADVCSFAHVCHLTACVHAWQQHVIHVKHQCEVQMSAREAMQ